MMEIIIFILYAVSIFLVLKQDLDSKYISMARMYSFVVMTLIYYMAVYGNIVWIILISLILLSLLTLDILEFKYGTLSLIWENWKLFGTWIYDYVLYSIILVLIVSDIVLSWFDFKEIFLILIHFIISLIFGVILLLIHHKRVACMIWEKNISDYDILDEALYNDELKKFSSFTALKKSSPLTKAQKILYLQYRKRVPLFIFGWFFIFSHIIFSAL